MKRLNMLFMVFVILSLLLQACNLQLAEETGGTDVPGFDLTVTANAALIETALASGALPPEAGGAPGTEDPAAPPANEVVIPAAVLPAAVGDVTVTVSVATNCRQGPGAAFASIYGMPVGQVAKVIAKNEASGYWIIEIPGQNGQSCWLWGKYATVTGDTSTLKVAVVPPSPATLTPTATKIGAATATASATPTATTSSSSGSGAVTGCMNHQGSNYNPQATIPGTCTYTKPNAPVFTISSVYCSAGPNPGEMYYQYTLEWADNSNNEFGFTVTTNNKLVPLPENSTSFSDTEIYPTGTVVNVRVVADNPAGASSPASAQFTCNPPVTKPSAPVITSASCTQEIFAPDGSAHFVYTLNWTDSNDSEDGYNVSGPEGDTGYGPNTFSHTGYFDWFAGTIIEVKLSVFNSKGNAFTNYTFSPCTNK